MANFRKSIVKIFGNTLIYTSFALASVSLQAQTDASKDVQYPESFFMSNPRQLIYEGLRSGEGYFSPDGNKMIFQSERQNDNPFYQMFVLDFESGDITRVTPGTGKTTCGFFQAKTGNVLFSSSHKDANAVKKQKDELDFRSSGKSRRYSWDYEPEMDIFISDEKGNNLKQLTNEKGYDAEAAFSPDGTKIIFSSNRKAFSENLSENEKKQFEIDPAYFCDIYIMDADGKNVKQLTNTNGYDGGPFFSPDGKRVIFRRFTPDGHFADIYTMAIDGSDEKKLTEFKSMSWAPYYHPSNKYVIFASNKFGFGNFEIFLVDIEGKKEPVRVSSTEGFDGLPVFSPDGNKLSWTSGRSANKSNQIFISEWNHENALKALENAPLRQSSNSAQVSFTPEIKQNELKAKVEYLASDGLEGRMTGSDGARLAANFAKSNFENLGLVALKNNSFEDKFEFISKIEINESKNTVKVGNSDLKLYQDFVPDVSSSNQNLSAELVFAGYGIKTPSESDVKYNSFEGIDLKGKIALILDGTPSDMDEKDSKILKRYSSDMYKIMIAREMGASAILIATNKEKLRRPDDSHISAKSALPVILLTKSGAETILKSSKVNLDELKETQSMKNPHARAFKLEKTEITINTDLQKVKSTDVNIIGMIPAAKQDQEYIFIGGHYDHLGKGNTSSLASDSDKQEIHNGADDNASGTSVVMELAEYFADIKKKNPSEISKNLVFCLWSGEELGLIGSQQFTENSKDIFAKTQSYLNFDMVGMLKDNKLMMQGLGSSSDWKKTLEKKNVLAGFNLTMQDDPYLPTDAMSFYKANVPVAAFFTGLHDHYHKPSDDINNLNYEGMERVAKYAASIIKDLMKMDTKFNFTKVEMASPSGTSRGFGVYLGTIPDYAAEVEGVKISDTRKGSPAEKGGLKSGDIIVKFAGKDIKNIYDYTNILSELKANSTYKMTVQRNSEKVELEITPINK